MPKIPDSDSGRKGCERLKSRERCAPQERSSLLVDRLAASTHMAHHISSAAQGQHTDSVERLQRYALPPSWHMACFPSHKWNARRLLAAEHARLHKRMRRMAATESKLRKGLGKVL